MLGSQPILEKTGFGNLRLGPPNKGVGVGHRSICEIMRLTEVETGRNLFRAFLRQPGKHSAQLCPAARGDTAPQVHPVKWRLWAQRRKRGVVNTTLHPAKASCPGWPHGTQDQALSGRLQATAVKKAASRRCPGQSTLRRPPWLHLLSIQLPRGPFAPVLASGTPCGLAPSRQVPAADGWWRLSAGPEPPWGPLKGKSRPWGSAW